MSESITFCSGCRIANARIRELEADQETLDGEVLVRDMIIRRYREALERIAAYDDETRKCAIARTALKGEET